MPSSARICVEAEIYNTGLRTERKNLELLHEYHFKYSKVHKVFIVMVLRCAGQNALPKTMTSLLVS
jgi:hypothetical protein